MAVSASVIEAVREEIATGACGSASQRCAELATLIQICGGMRVGSHGELVCEIRLESEFSVQRLHSHIAALGTTGVHAGTFARGLGTGSPVWVTDVLSGATTLARTCGLITRSGHRVAGLPPAVIRGGTAQAAAAWRGALLGSARLITRGGQDGTLIVQCPNVLLAVALEGCARRLGVITTTRLIRGRYRVRVRRMNNIVVLLERIGLREAGQRLEPLLERSPRSGATETPHAFLATNMARTAAAGRLGAQRARRALEILGDQVRPELQEIAQRRIDYPTATLTELGLRCDPPVSKDTASGRLRRLLVGADTYARRRGLPDTTESNQSWHGHGRGMQA